MRLFWTTAILFVFHGATVAHIVDPRCMKSVDLFQPREGVISSAKIAEAAALIYLNPIYGKRHIRGELPLNATLRDGIWTVTGTLAPFYIGGTAEIRLCQRNGTVLSVIHGK